jgi:hypothetical protein
MDLLLALAVGIKLFRQETEAFTLRLCSVGKRKRFEAARFVVAGIIAVAHPSAGSKRPRNVDPTVANLQVRDIDGERSSNRKRSAAAYVRPPPCWKPR